MLLPLLILMSGCGSCVCVCVYAILFFLHGGTFCSATQPTDRTDRAKLTKQQQQQNQTKKFRMVFLTTNNAQYTQQTLIDYINNSYFCWYFFFFNFLLRQRRHTSQQCIKKKDYKKNCKRRGAKSLSTKIAFQSVVFKIYIAIMQSRGFVCFFYVFPFYCCFISVTFDLKWR